MAKLRPENNIAALSYLRIAATLGVILLHVSSTLLANAALFAPLSAGEVRFHAAVMKLTTWCVPCFLMISGALLLRPEKPITVGDCVFHYARRMALALIVFGVPFALLSAAFETGGFSLHLLPGALLRVLGNEPVTYLWYLYMMIGIYLTLPILKPFADHCSRSRMEYVLILLLVFNFAIPCYQLIRGMRVAFELPLTSCFVLYFLLGHYLTRHAPEWMKNPWLNLAGIAVCAVIDVAASVEGSGVPGILSEYGSPFTAVMSACVFNLFMRIDRPCPPLAWALDRLSFGVYLIHLLPLHLAYRVLRLAPVGALYPVKTLAAVLAVAATAYGLSWLLMKIPPLRKYVL